MGDTDTGDGKQSAETSNQPGTGTDAASVTNESRSTVSKDFCNDILRHIDEKFESLKRLVNDDKDRNKRARTESDFKKKGHWEQCRHNDEVRQSLKRASSELNAGNTERVQEYLKEGMAIIDKRDKMILLADKSEAGWLAVNKYEKLDFASDSEDEKRMRKSSNEALRELKNRKTTFRKRRDFREQRNTRFQRESTDDHKYPPVNITPKYESKPGRGGRTYGSRPGNCFKCGRAGHWEAECRN